MCNLNFPAGVLILVCHTPIEMELNSKICAQYYTCPKRQPGMATEMCSGSCMVRSAQGLPPIAAVWNRTLAFRTVISCCGEFTDTRGFGWWKWAGFARAHINKRNWWCSAFIRSMLQKDATTGHICAFKVTQDCNQSLTPTLSGANPGEHPADQMHILRPGVH